MKITFDDRLLIVGSEDGTLIIWVIVNTEGLLTGHREIANSVIIFHFCFNAIGKTASVDTEHGKCADIIVPRNDLIENVQRIEHLENRLNQHMSEHTFELEQTRKQQSLEMQRTCEKYENELKKIKAERQTLELKYCEERNLISAAIEERNTEHSTTIIQLEAKLNEKILSESNKSADLKVEMDKMKADYEEELHKAAEYLQNTVDTLKRAFDEELKRREENASQLRDEIQMKKEEFFHYCQQLNLDNDRKVAQLKLNYETQLRECNDNLLKWRTEASILTKKIESTSKTCDQLRADISVLLDEHNRNKKYICQLEQNITELQRDIDVRNKLVMDKEICLAEAIQKNQAMEQLKQFFNERAIELEIQIKPLNDEIKQQYCKISEMEEGRQKLQWKVDDLNIEIEQLKNRCKAIQADFKVEKIKSSHLETVIQRMCSDISALVQNIQDAHKLKESALILFKTYVLFRFHKSFFD